MMTKSHDYSEFFVFRLHWITILAVSNYELCILRQAFTFRQFILVDCGRRFTVISLTLLDIPG